MIQVKKQKRYQKVHKTQYTSNEIASEMSEVSSLLEMQLAGIEELTASLMTMLEESGKLRDLTNKFTI